jgi:hypothetical protein
MNKISRNTECTQYQYTDGRIAFNIRINKILHSQHYKIITKAVITYDL